jgi:hypothetical protein
LSDFNESGIFATDFRKNFLISNFMKIHPVGAGGVVPMQTDGRTDRRDKANGHFLQFCARA